MPTGASPSAGASLGGGGGLGSAWAKIFIDASGVMSGVRQANAALGGLKTTVATAGAAVATGFATAAAGVAVAGAAIATTITGIVYAAGRLAMAAAPIEGITGAFHGLAQSFEGGSDAMLAAMQRSSAGLITNSELMRQYNLAAQLVGKEFAHTLPEAFEYLGKVSAATGQDMDYLLNSLTVGIGRLSAPILDNLAIQVDLNKAYQDFAEKNGLVAGSLTKSQQQAALTAQVMEKLAENTASMPPLMGSATQVFGTFRTTLQNIREDIGTHLLPTFIRLFSIFQQFLPILQAFGQGFAGVFANIIDVGLEFVRSLAEGLGINFDTLAGDAETWGANIVTMLANGMAAAASAVISVLNELGQMIAYWLAPGSPPRLLPNLPAWGASAMTEFMNGWASADFSVFDRIGGTLESLIRNLGASLPKVDMVNMIIGSQSAIADAVQQFREFGQVSEETMQAIVTAAGPAGDAIQAYIEGMLQMEGAAAALAKTQNDLRAVQQLTAQTFEKWAADIDGAIVPAVNAYRQALSNLQTIETSLKAAQNELQTVQNATTKNWREMAAALVGTVSPATRAHLESLRQLEQANIAYESAQARVNEITKRYSGILDPLNQQLQELRDQQAGQREAEELARINEDIADGWLEGAELQEALRRRQEILLTQQIRDATRRRDAELGAAKDVVEAAEDEQRAAEEKAEATKQSALEAARAEVEALEQARDAAIEAAEAQREAMIAAAESQVAAAQAQVDALDEQIKLNDAILKQMQDMARLQAELAKAMEAEASGGGGAGGAGGAGKVGGGAGGPKFDFSKPDTDDLFDGLDLETKFSEMFDNVSNIFDPVMEQAQELGETWAGVVEGLQEKWGTFTGMFGSGAGSFQGKLQSIINALSPLLPVYERVFNTIREKLALVGQFFVEQGSKIRTWAADNEGLINNFLGVMGTLVGGIITVVGAVYSEMTGILDLVLIVLGGVVDVIIGWATIIMQVVTGDIAGAFDTLLQLGATVWNNFKDLLVAFVDWVAGWFGSSWEDIKTTWSGIWENLKEIVTLAWVAIREAFTTAWSGITTWFDEQVTTFVEGWSSFWSGLQTKAAEIVEAVRSFVTSKLQELFAAMGLDLDTMKARWSAIWEDVQLIAATVWDRIKTAVSEKFTELRTSLETSLNTLKTWWDTTWTEIKTRLETIWGLIKTAVSSRMGEVRTDVETKVSGLREWWTTAWTEIKTRLETIWSDIKIAIGNKLTEIRSLVEERINAVRSWIEEQTSRFTDIGANLIQGIAQGILDNAGAVIAAITGVVEWAISLANSLLGNASPSKVFTEIGMNAMLGMANGLKKIEPVMDALTRMKDAVVGQAMTIKKGVKDQMLGIWDGFKPPANAAADAVRQAAGGALSIYDDFRALPELLADTASRMRKVAPVWDMAHWGEWQLASVGSMNVPPVMGKAGMSQFAAADGSRKETYLNLGQMILPNVTDGDELMRELTDYTSLY